uniref:TMEM127 domain-containing protein n=1 Tax=Macrostomum lignano TaxID=282301 RepID=A0A1I8IIC2_9PLAT
PSQQDDTELLQPLLNEADAAEADASMQQEQQISSTNPDASSDGRQQQQQQTNPRIPVLTRTRAWFCTRLANARRDSELLDPYQEASRNLPAAVCSGCVLALLAMSSGAADWFYTRGGGCNRVYIGTGAFLANGELFQRTRGDATLVCVTACGLTYWAAELIRGVQEATQLRPDSHVTVSLCSGYYLVGAAGLLSILAAAFNCLHQPRHIRRLRMSLTQTPASSARSSRSRRHRRRSQSQSQSQSSRSRRSLWPFRLRNRLSLNSGDVVVNSNQPSAQPPSAYPDDGLGPPPDDEFDEAQLLLGIADYDPPAYEVEFGEQPQQQPSEADTDVAPVQP